MSKIKIQESGFHKFTGDIGGVEFENGISLEDMSRSEIKRFSASMRVVEVLTEEEDGVVTGDQLGVSADLVKQKNTSAPVHKKLDEIDEDSRNDAKDDIITRDQLEFIADQRGIHGVREIASQFGVKGKSISEIIDGVIEAQKADDK